MDIMADDQQQASTDYINSFTKDVPRTNHYTVSTKKWPVYFLQ